MNILHPLLPAPLYLTLVSGLTAIIAIALGGDPHSLRQMIAVSGGVSIWMLMICVAMGPALWFVGSYPALKTLVGRARVTMAAFALLASGIHAWLYIYRKGEMQIIIAEAPRAQYLVAWVGGLFLIAACVAVLITALRKHATINIWLDSGLGLALLLFVAHWFLLNGQSVFAIILQLLPLAGLEALRLALSRRTA